MTDEVQELNFEISAYVYELHELQQVIKDLSEQPEADPVYMTEAGERYVKLCEKLKITLECYFKEESKAGLPTEFSYRKLYKQLVS